MTIITTAAALAILVTSLVLAGAVIGWALRDFKQKRRDRRVIDLRDRIEPYAGSAIRRPTRRATAGRDRASSAAS